MIENDDPYMKPSVVLSERFNRIVESGRINSCSDSLEKYGTIVFGFEFMLDAIDFGEPFVNEKGGGCWNKQMGKSHEFVFRLVDGFRTKVL